MINKTDSFADVAKTMIIFSMVLMMNGCGGPDVVEGVPRGNSNPAKFNVGRGDTEPRSEIGKELAFIPANFSGLLRVNAAGVLLDPALAELPWDSVQKELGSVVGEQNADLKNLRYLWVFLDKELPFLGGDSGGGLPLVVVLEFIQPPELSAIPDKFELAVAEPNFSEANNGEKPPRDGAPDIVVKAIDANRIAIGSSALVGKFNGKQNRSLVATELEAMDSSNDIQGIVDVTAYRSMFEMVTGMANAFGAPSLGPIARLPEELRKIELSASISGEEMVELTAAFEDEEFVQEIAVILNDQLEQMLSANQGSGSKGGSTIGRLGGFPGRDGEPMLVPTMMEPMATVAAEISDSDLVSLAMASDQLTLKMKRPKNLNQLIKAIVEDGVKQSELSNRQQSLETIAAALKTYHSENGFLPPAGWVSNSEGKARPQFNWRVGLLPELGEQELYDQFDFSLPWDAPENQKVAQKMPAVFAGASSLDGDDGAKGTTTNLRVIGGKLGVYKSDEPPVLEDVSDKAIWTSVVIECAAGDAVQWTKPGPLTLAEISPNRFGRSGENGVMFIDGRFSVRVVRKDDDLISAVITTDGGEKLKSKDFIKLK
eukprot:COSAG01_NODE_750_length_13844_cov_149.079593_11_plen_599_part_00